MLAVGLVWAKIRDFGTYAIEKGRL